MSRPLLLVMVVLLARAASLQCPAGRQFWDSALQQCRDCSHCAPPAVVLRPCGVHRDALCGPIADLNIDWSWIDGRRRPDQLDIALLEDAPLPHHHLHHHHHHRTSAEDVAAPSTTTPGTSASPPARKRARKGAEKTSSPAASRRKRKRKPSSPGEEYPRQKAAHGRTRQRRKHGRRRGDDHEQAAPSPPPSASFLKSDERARRPPEAASQVLARPDAPPPAPRETEKPFSTVESIVWDGQAFALVVAVSACLLFFVVAAAYSIYQARHWRRLSTNFEADVEELSAQLSLVASGCVVVEPHAATPPPSPGDVGGGKTQCSYLEQLLACKQEGERANVYIDRQSSVKEPPAPPSSMKE